MVLTELTDRAAVLSAMQEYDALSQAAFLEKYGYAPARGFRLVYHGKNYDSKTIVGVAFKYQFSDRGPLQHSEFSAGEATVVPLLERLGFEVQPIAGRVKRVETTITAEDVKLIRQSRSKSRYGDPSHDERSACERYTAGSNFWVLPSVTVLRTGQSRLKLTMALI